MSRKWPAAIVMILVLGGVQLASWNSSAAPEGDPSKPQVVHDGEANRVRMPLFNGENLDGWHVTNCDVVVENDALVLKGGDGFVRTDHRYSDFVLELEWRALKASEYDSGIYLRCELPTGERPWPTRYQANLAQGKEGNIAALEGAMSGGLIKPGEWNAFKFTVQGEQIELEINGQPAWSAKGLEADDGFIGLQAEVPLGGQFEFRKIFITELDHVSMFNGKDLAGWNGADADASACWQVENGELTCTGKPGPWLRTQSEFDDFNFRLEYKLLAGGNSGVYVRVPADGNHHGAGAGVEIQILDDNDERYKNIEPYQYCGSVYAVVAANQHVCRPPGHWNSLEINCQRDRFIVIHNGVVVIDANAEKYPELAMRRLEGFFGLQNHSERVSFRNLRIGAARE